MDDTLPKLLRRNARRYANQPALREKRFGIWGAITWAQYYERVRHFALGLHCLGFERGNLVAVIGDNRPEWVITELAAQSLGGASIGIYQDSVADEVTYIAQQCQARYIVAEDQEQVDKLLDIREQIPTLNKIIYYDPKGLRNYNDPVLLSFVEVEALGREYHQKHPDAFERFIDQGKGEDVAIVSTTSGTTSRPKLARLSHSNLIAMGEGIMSFDRYGADDDFVSFLPLAWIGEQMLSMACGLQAGFALNFPEEPETVQHDLREIGPHIIFAPPRIWENMVSTVQVKIEDSSRVKKAFFNWAMNVGQRLADKRFAKQPLSGLERLQERIAYYLVFNNLLDQLGMKRVKWAYTGGAALSPDIFRFFHAMGVNLKQGYGQTETSGICVVHRDGDIKFQTVGKAMPGAEVKVDESGEILVRGKVAFQGYFRNEAATAETITHDGWVRTGDAGYFDEDGHLIVIDRAKDVMTLHDGTKFSPQFIENKLKFSLYVREAVVFGGGNYPYVTAMINIDFGNVGKWAENNKMAYTTYTDLSQKPQVYALVRTVVERTNQDLPPAARIRRFVLLHKELDADDAELTRTRKVRRNFIAQRYQDIVNGLYSDAQNIQIESTITYQDGRTATLQIQLRMETVQA
ncbi:MAG: AMP-binding protein [Anaerolineae bacterium]|nr:AMP-binding protein [Anaerolineae bacterium]MDW8172710.1 AMP-binding protein [Anaerolineae bacterium]